MLPLYIYILVQLEEHNVIAIALSVLEAFGP